MHTCLHSGTWIAWGGKLAAYRDAPVRVAHEPQQRRPEDLLQHARCERARVQLSALQATRFEKSAYRRCVTTGHRRVVTVCEISVILRCSSPA